MVNSLIYTPGTPGAETIDLYSDTAWIGKLGDLRSVAWSYDLTIGNLTGLNRPASDRTARITCTDPDRLDAMRSAFYADLIRRTPGTLTVNGQWSQRCYATTSEPDHTAPNLVTADITFAMLDGVWRRELETIQCTVHQDDSANAWLDLPCDLPIDLQATRMNVSVANPLPYAIPWRIIIYGPASNPRISIGANEHMVDVLVPDGGYLTIDSIAKTVTLTAANGDTSNEFGNARRGRGVDGGEYIFQPIPSGTTTVEWDGSFGFDLTPIEERSAPPWSTLS